MFYAWGMEGPATLYYFTCGGWRGMQPSSVSRRRCGGIYCPPLFYYVWGGEGSTPLDIIVQRAVVYPPCLKRVVCLTCLYSPSLSYEWGFEVCTPPMFTHGVLRGVHPSTILRVGCGGVCTPPMFYTCGAEGSTPLQHFRCGVWRGLHTPNVLLVRCGDFAPLQFFTRGALKGLHPSIILGLGCGGVCTPPMFYLWGVGHWLWVMR